MVPFTGTSTGLVVDLGMVSEFSWTRSVFGRPGTTGVGDGWMGLVEDVDVTVFLVSLVGSYDGNVGKPVGA